MRLIDADALMATLGITDMDCNKCAWHDSEWDECQRGGEFEDACCAIENAPTIEERKGKWICWYEEIESDTCTEYIPRCKCLKCGTEYDPHSVKFINFCPYCGAKMEGEEHETDRP